MKRIIVLCIFIILQIGIVKGQETQFSQFYANPLYLAPSFAGAHDGDRATASFRDQWPSFSNAFISYAFGYDHYFPRLKSGVGLLFFREQAGSGNLATTNIGLLYSYNVHLTDKWQFRPGLHFMYTQRSLDFNSLTFGDELINDDQGGTIEAPPLERKSAIDASGSLLFYSAKYWVGFTMDHILQPNRSLVGGVSKDPYKFSFFGGAKIPILRRYNKPSGQSLSPAYLFKYQDVNSQLDIGLYWYQMPLVLGVWYRGIPVFKDNASNDAIAFLVGYKLDQFNFGYSYDFTISQLVGFSGGSHEISVSILFNQGLTDREKRRPIPCPTF